MQDVRFLLVIIATSLSTYFNRDDELEEFLDRYNDEFPMRDEIRRELESTFAFIESLQLPDSARIWKKADLFTAIVELHAATHKRGKRLDAKRVADRLQQFYLDVDDSDRRGASESNASRYYKAALQATTDRGSRILRGMIFRETLDL